MINVLLFNRFCIPGQYNAHNSFFNTICSYDCVHFGPEQLLDFMTCTNEFNCETLIEAVHFTLINVILYLKYLAIPHLDFKMVRIIKIISYLNHHLQVSMSHHRSE